MTIILNRNHIDKTAVLYLKVVGVQVGLVLGILAISVVTTVNDGVEKISENFVGLLITGNAADGHDERMSGVVHTGLDDAVEGASRGGDLLGERVRVRKRETMCENLMS